MDYDLDPCSAISAAFCKIWIEVLPANGANERESDSSQGFNLRPIRAIRGEFNLSERLVAAEPQPPRTCAERKRMLAWARSPDPFARLP